MVRGDKKIWLQVNNVSATVNDTNITLDVPAEIMNDRIVVPARFIAEAFGTNVGWESGTRIVRITLEEVILDTEIIFCDIDRQYIDVNGMGVTVKSIKKTEKTGSIIYRVEYQLENKTSDKKIDEGTFKVFLKDGNYENQYGFFGTLFPSDIITRVYEFEFLKINAPIILEYNGYFFDKTPSRDTQMENGLIFSIIMTRSS